jgi:catechol 2,3-dioxygenase-like lactoylglutathione lyase family enzyme
MIRRIDHLVIACTDPDAAAAELSDKLGLAVTGGGRHQSGGTWNRIAWLADGSYLELIGVDDRDAALTSAVGAAAVRSLDQHGGGLATFALADDDLEITVRRLRAAGSSLSDPLRGSRLRDDGEVVEWWVSVPGSALGPRSVPFLIQHAEVGAEWGHAALAERATFLHPIGSPVILARVDVATDDPPSLAAQYHDELGLDVWAVADLAVCTVGRHVMRLVPNGEIDAPAVVTIGAHVDAPRTVNALGVRFDVERVEALVPAVPGA